MRYVDMPRKAIQYLIQSLIRRRKTEKQVREKLLKIFPEIDQEPIVSRLKELGYLNDKDFSRAWLRHRLTTSPRGKYILRRELKRKGVSDTDISESLTEYDEAPVLLALACRKWPRITGHNHSKRREKLLRFLLSRGFRMSGVLEVVNSIALQEEN